MSALIDWVSTTARAREAVSLMVCDADREDLRERVARISGGLYGAQVELDGKSGLALIALGIAALNATNEHHMRDAGKQIRVCFDLVVMLASDVPIVSGPKPGEPER